ncbi:MAG: hypothetical protein IV094_11790 [Vitreoscilla sp.]|nr:hypothetical protein [Vitreoscilla sp.]
MYRIQVFDVEALARRWRDVVIIRDDHFGWDSAFSDERTEYDNLVEALEVVEGLVADSKVRAGIFAVAGELIYDSASPVDLRNRPDFQLAEEGPWVERFVSVLGELRPDVATNFLAAMGQRLYPDLRHECPETVAWDEFHQWAPSGLEAGRYRRDQ